MKLHPRAIYTFTVAVWAFGFVAHAVAYVVHVLSLPPIDEVYTRSVPFQLTAFMYVWGGYWVGALLLVLLVEFATVGRRPKD